MATLRHRRAVFALVLAALGGCDLRPIVVPPGGLTGEDAGNPTPRHDAASSSDGSSYEDVLYSSDAGSIDAATGADAGADVPAMTPPTCDDASTATPDGALVLSDGALCGPAATDGGDAAPSDAHDDDGG